MCSAQRFRISTGRHPSFISTATNRGHGAVERIKFHTTKPISAVFKKIGPQERVSSITRLYRRILSSIDFFLRSSTSLSVEENLHLRTFKAIPFYEALDFSTFGGIVENPSKLPAMFIISATNNSYSALDGAKFHSTKPSSAVFKKKAPLGRVTWFIIIIVDGS